MKQLLVIFTSLCVLVPVKAQDVLTLEECLRLGIENNLSFWKAAVMRLEKENIH